MMNLLKPINNSRTRGIAGIAAGLIFILFNVGILKNSGTFHPKILTAGTTILFFSISILILPGGYVRKHEIPSGNQTLTFISERAPRLHKIIRLLSASAGFFAGLLICWKLEHSF